VVTGEHQKGWDLPPRTEAARLGNWNDCGDSDSARRVRERSPRRGGEDKKDGDIAGAWRGYR
jgi:hypothetical protein